MKQRGVLLAVGAMTPGEENHNETDWQSVYQKVEKFYSKLKDIEKRREEKRVKKQNKRYKRKLKKTQDIPSFYTIVAPCNKNHQKKKKKKPNQIT